MFLPGQALDWHGIGKRQPLLPQPTYTGNGMNTMPSLSTQHCQGYLCTCCYNVAAVAASPPILLAKGGDWVLHKPVTTATLPASSPGSSPNDPHLHRLPK
jgi:hypothetical protein